jgi:hypothetical protein
MALTLCHTGMDNGTVKYKLLCRSSKFTASFIRILKPFQRVEYITSR